VDVHPPEGPPDKPAALQLELPSSLTSEHPSLAGPERRPAALSRHGTRRAMGWIVGVTLFALAVAVAVETVLPRYVRRAFIEEANAHGIALTIDDARVTRAGFELLGVKATASDVPGASASAPRVQIQTSDLHPQRLTATGMEISLEGRWSDVAAAFARWRASEHGGQGGAWAPVSLVINSSHIVWRGPIGENALVEAGDVHVDIAWPDREPAIHGTSSHVTVVAPGGLLGPWRVDLDREPGATRARVALDPEVPDACTLLVIGDGTVITSADLVIPRSPIGRLGIPQAMLALRGDIQLEAGVHYAVSGTRLNATAKGGLYGATVRGMTRPIDVAWDVSSNGDARGEIDLREARVAVGPLVGAAIGTVKTFDDGFRLDLAWHAGPVPCAAFDAPLGPGQPFDIAYSLRKLAEGARLARVMGEVAARATMVFDSRDLGATTLNFAPKANCAFVLGDP
jgi:hypothetical protein